VLQDRGYFRANVSAKAEVLSKDAERERVSLSIRVDPGPQYRLGRMQFRSADPDVPLVFPTPELRKLAPMRDGDIFDVSKLRTGFGALKKFYASSGWIDFTPTPNFAIDDAAKQINLTLELDQERQYRVGQIEVWGDNPAAEKILRSELTAGEPFNAFILEKFYSENKSILPLDASPQDDVQVNKDVRTGIVNFRFDFRTCPVVSE
jgi:outer membrane protein assembly factor BamA